MMTPPRPSPRLVIYDLDGTLLDSFADIAAAVNHGMRRFGLEEHSPERIRTFVGDGLRKCVERALDAGHGKHTEHASRIDEVLSVVSEFYGANPTALGGLYPGVEAMLGAVGRAGICQAVLTNKPHAIAMRAAEQTGLDALLDAVQGAVDGVALKPDPEGINRLMERFGVGVERTLYIGDGRPDVEAASAAGVPCLGVAWGVEPPERLLEIGAKATAGSPAELCDLILNELP